MRFARIERFARSASDWAGRESMSTRELCLVVWGIIGLGVVASAAVSVFRPSSCPPSAGPPTPSWPRRGGAASLTLGWMWLGWHLFAR